MSKIKEEKNMKKGLKVWLWIVFAWEVFGVASLTDPLSIIKMGIGHPANWLALIGGILLAAGCLLAIFKQNNLAFWIGSVFELIYHIVLMVDRGGVYLYKTEAATCILLILTSCLLAWLNRPQKADGAKTQA